MLEPFALPWLPTPSPKNSALPADVGMRNPHPRLGVPLTGVSVGDELIASTDDAPTTTSVGPPPAPSRPLPSPPPYARCIWWWWWWWWCSASLIEFGSEASKTGAGADELEFQVATLAAAMGGAGVPFVTGPVFGGVVLCCCCCSCEPLLPPDSRAEFLRLRRSELPSARPSDPLSPPLLASEFSAPADTRAPPTPPREEDTE